MWVILLIIVGLYFLTGLVANLIDIYKFFAEREED